MLNPDFDDVAGSAECALLAHHGMPELLAPGAMQGATNG